MLKSRLYLFALILLCTLTGVQAQETEQDSLAKYPNVQAIIKAEDVSKFPEVYKFFIEGYQKNSFSALTKTNLLKTLINLDKQCVRIRYDIREVMESLQLAKEQRNFSIESMENLTYAMLKATETFDRIKLNAYYSRLNSFIKNLTLYQDRYQSITVVNGEFEIAFNEDNYDEEVVIVNQEPAEELDAETLRAMANGTYVPAVKEVLDPMSEELPEMYRELGAVIHLKKGDLQFASNSDTFSITGVQGYYRFDQDIFKGQDGIVDWENVGIPRSEMQVRLSEYTFKPNQRVYDFENVLLSQPAKADEPVSGILQLNIRPSRNEIGTFPRFTSYNANTPLKGIGSEKLTFNGGVSYQGADFYSKTAYEELSGLSGQLDGNKTFKARSKDFVFNNNDSTVTAANADLTLYQNGDSITHPAVEFYYDYQDDLLTAETNVQGYKTTPFRTSFYNVDVSGDRLSWDIKSDSLNLFITSARADVPLIIESKDFYTAERFYDLAQIFSFHPLIMAVNMAKKNGGNSFYTSQMARDNNLGEGLVNKTMELLMSRGMVRYDRVSGEVTVTDKGYHYLRSSGKKPDYDDILIPSIIPSAPNATMNFKDSILTIRGVETFLVSDSLDVIIFPTNGELRMLKNRDMEFDGSLNAGNFQFNGSQFTFRYDSFLVNLTQIDSIKLQVELDAGKREALNNQLVKTSGTLVINETDNKSALRPLPQYPIFTSTESASVEFQKNNVLEGAYDSTVYFEVPPFTLDSVADADPNNYAFQGTFHSGDILPIFKEDLKVMKDLSFGFVHSVPDSGYNLYKTGGRVYGELQLDSEGISTPGIIEYLTGTFDTERATLFLDSMVTEKGIKGSLESGFVDTVSYPSMEVEAYDMNWLAKQDSMILKNKEAAKPFQIFEKRAKLNGELVLRKTGLLGSGEMELEGSRLESDSIGFEQYSFKSKNTNLTINSGTAAKPILSSTDVRVNFDIENQTASIEPEVAGTAALEFPFAQFKTSIPNALWDVNQKSIAMRKPDDAPLEQSFFYSTNRRLDSLAFNATEGYYDIEKKELNVKGIPFIEVADAKITPEGNELNILENSRIEKLQNAVIVIDTANAYHRLYNAEVEILSRNRFRGSGTYELVNAVQDTFSILFDQFQFVENDEENGPHTKSSGTVKASDGIRVSPGFIFEGQVTMYAYKKALELDGAVRLDMEQLNERNIWIEYYSNDSIQEVIIPFDEALTRQGLPLNAGIHFSEAQPYMSFITEKKNDFDDDFFVPRGGSLYFDSNSDTYRIENQNKRNDASAYFAGSMFSYDEIDKEVTFEGKLNFLAGNGMSNIQSAGKGGGNLDSFNFEVNAMFSMNFGLSVEGLAAMGQNLKTQGETLGVQPALDDRSELIYRVAEFIGDDATRSWDKSYEVVPINLVNAGTAGELLRDLVITDVNLKWSKQSKAFYSVGKIGVSNVSNIHLDMELDGFMEIRKTPEGDIMTLLLQMTDGTWYYFMYDGFSFSSFSSNEAYNSLVTTANSGKTKIGNFRVFGNTLVEVNKWVMDYRKLYLGIDEPYRLVMAGDSNQQLKKKAATEGDGF